MPLVRIELLEGWSEQQRTAIADATHAAMVATLSVPERDRFQIITMHAPEDLGLTAAISTWIAQIASC